MGAGMDIASGLAGSILGTVETAYLAVDDRRLDAPAPVPSEDGKALNKKGSDKAKAKAKTSKVTALADVVLGRNGKPPPDLQGAAKYFKVQFNPSELQLNSASTRETKQSIQIASEGGGSVVLNRTTVKPKAVLSLSIYFDDLNKADAFAGDKFNFDPASLGANIATAVVVRKGRIFSVQPQVDALVSALHNSCTRQLTFYWADFSFSGSLIFLDSRYTMFSPTGRPIRAQVNLRIQQEGDDTKLKNWYDDFANSFEDSTSLVRASQKVSSLLNINL